MKTAARKFMDTEITAPIPHIVAVVLSCLAGAAQVLNQTLLGVTGSWHAYIGLGIAALAYIGIKPLVGAQFRAAVRVPALVAQVLTALVGIATVVGGQLQGAPSWVQPALAAGVTVLIGLGFGPAGSQVADAAKARRDAARKQVKA